MSSGIDLVKFQENTQQLNNPSDFSGKVYVMSNENNISKCRKIVEKVAVKREAFVGVSGLDNWEMICSVDAQIAVLFDYNPKVVKFHQLCLKILLRVESRKEFVSKVHEVITIDSENYHFNSRYMTESIVGLPFKDPKFKEALRLIELTDRFLSTGERKSPLSTDAGFLKLKEMAKEGRIIPICADLADTKTMAAISSNIKELGCRISTIYLSNVYDHGLRSKDPSTSKKMKLSITALCSGLNPLIIDATYYRNGPMVNRYVAWWKQPDETHYDLDQLRDLKIDCTQVL